MSESNADTNTENIVPAKEENDSQEEKPTPKRAGKKRVLSSDLQIAQEAEALIKGISTPENENEGRRTTRSRTRGSVTPATPPPPAKRERKSTSSGTRGSKRGRPKKEELSDPDENDHAEEDQKKSDVANNVDGKENNVDSDKKDEESKDKEEIDGEEKVTKIEVAAEADESEKEVSTTVEEVEPSKEETKVDESKPMEVDGSESADAKPALSESNSSNVHSEESSKEAEKVGDVKSVEKTVEETKKDTENTSPVLPSEQKSGDEDKSIKPVSNDTAPKDSESVQEPLSCPLPTSVSK